MKKIKQKKQKFSKKEFFFSDSVCVWVCALKHCTIAVRYSFLFIISVLFGFFFPSIFHTFSLLSLRLGLPFSISFGTHLWVCFFVFFCFLLWLIGELVQLCVFPSLRFPVYRFQYLQYVQTTYIQYKYDDQLTDRLNPPINHEEMHMDVRCFFFFMISNTVTIIVVIPTKHNIHTRHGMERHHAIYTGTPSTDRNNNMMDNELTISIAFIRQMYEKETLFIICFVLILTLVFWNGVRYDNDILHEFLLFFSSFFGLFILWKIKKKKTSKSSYGEQWPIVSYATHSNDTVQVYEFVWLSFSLLSNFIRNWIFCYRCMSCNFIFVFFFSFISSIFCHKTN